MTENSTYLDAVRQYPLLTRDEERELLEHKDEKPARDKLILSNLRLVLKIANEYKSMGDLDDLIQAGTIGLINAIDTYDPAFGTKLSTHSYYVITGAILQHLREDRLIHIPDYLQRKGYYGPSFVQYESLEEMTSHKGHPEKEAMALEKTRALYKALDELGEEAKQMIILRYGLDGKGCRSYETIAKMTHHGKAYPSKKIKELIQSLGPMLSDFADYDTE